MIEYGFLSGSGSAVTNGLSDWFASLTRVGGELLGMALDNPAQAGALILLLVGIGWFLQRR